MRIRLHILFFFLLIGIGCRTLQVTSSKTVQLQEDLNRTLSKNKRARVLGTISSLRNALNKTEKQLIQATSAASESEKSVTNLIFKNKDTQIQLAKRNTIIVSLSGLLILCITLIGLKLYRKIQLPF